MLAGVLVLLLAGRAAGAVTATAEWGFEGTVVPGGPNLLTVTLDNPGTDPVEGTVVLQEGASVFSHTGAPAVAQVFVAPHSARSVQFAPWIGRDNKWTISGTALGGSDLVLDEPRQHAPGRVLIASPDALGAPRGAGLAVFSEERFPDTVSLCDSLGEAVLDHVPRRWSPAQRQALHDWVVGGGTLDVLKGSDGHYPEFTGELADFVKAEGRCGQGQVVHLDATLAAPPAGWHGHGANEDDDDRSDSPHAMHRQDRDVLEDNAKQDFQGLVRPHLPWAAINLLLLVFLGLVGFGPLIASRRGVDWRWVNAAVVLLIVLCCLAVVALGRRGYGESSQMRTLAVARWIDGKVYDVTMHTNLFVIASGHYSLAHAGKPNLYCSSDDTDAGTEIQLADGGSFQPVVPLFSNCPFRVRLRTELPCPLPTAGADGHTLALNLPGARVLGACLAHAGAITAMSVSGTGDQGVQLTNDGNATPYDNYAQDYRYGNYNAGREEDRDNVMRNLFALAVREDCLRTGADVDPAKAARQGAPADGAAAATGGTWLYVLIDDLPPNLKATTGTAMAQDGAVVYCFPMSEAP
jgi:hypothetical protein